MTQKTFSLFAWTAVTISFLLTILAWGEGVNWQIGSLNSYQWFPLFGLLAWMIMATHYYSGALRVLNPHLKKPAYYSRSTGYLVLGSLLLHPGILAYSQWRNGLGLPPESFTSYVGESLQLAAFMGSVALTLFLAFEVFDRMKNKPIIKKYWWVISLSQTFAMLLIFVHGLRLGGSMEGWFLTVWYMYGLLLVPCFYVIHKNELTILQERAAKK